MTQSYIYIGQYHGKSLISRLIRWRTWSEISHTAALLLNKQKVVEAWTGGVRKRPWTDGHTPGTRIDIYRVACTKEQRDAFYQFLTEQVGTPYDYFALLGFALRGRIQNRQKWFCSELIFTAAQQAGIDLLARVEPYKVSPGELNISPLLELVETRTVPGAKKLPVKDQECVT